MNHRLGAPRTLGRLGAILVVGAFALVSVVGAATAAPGDAPSPSFAVGGRHVCALPGDGTVLCWGHLDVTQNEFGELGDGFVTDPEAPAGDVWVQHVVIADDASAQGGDCVDITPDGFVLRCHGSTSLSGVIAITAGYSHTCALLADTTVKCWGANAAHEWSGDPIDPVPSYSGGAVGDGTTSVRPAPVTVIAGPGQTAALSGVRNLSAAAFYTCAVLVDNTAKCWGNSPQESSLAPITVMADDTRPLTQVASIATGDDMACAALLDGSVVCWGKGLLGDQLSEGRIQSIVPVTVTVAGASPTALGGIASVAAANDVGYVRPNGFGMGHSCALDNQGGVSCWGLNDVSQVGSGVPPGLGSFDYAVPVAAAPDSSELLSGVTSIAAGGYFTCALIEDGSVRCWGLGLGGDSFEGGGAPVPLTIGPLPVTSIAAGGGTVCARLVDATLWCSDAEYTMTAVPGIDIAAAAPTPTPPPTPTPTATPAPTTSGTPAPTPSAASTQPATPIPTGVSSPSPAPPLIATDVDGLAGDWNVTYGAPAAVIIAFADGQYSVVAKSPVRVTGSSCDLAPGTLIATFSGSGGSYSGQHGLWFISNCSFGRWTTVTLTLDGNRLTAVLGDGEQAVFSRATVAFRDSVPTPGQITLDPIILLQSLAIAVGFVLLIPFPGALFDSTLEANYAEVTGWGRSARKRLSGIGFRRPGTPVVTDGDAPKHVGDGWRTPSRLALALVLGVLLGCLLDPTFGLNLVSAATFAGVLGGVLVTLFVFSLPSVMAYRSNRRSANAADPAGSPNDDPGSWDPYIRALPAALVVAIACVLISRLTSFQPGYLYGLIIGVAAGHELSDTQSARTAVVATVLMLLVAFAAWISLGLVQGVAPAGSDPGLALILLKTALVTVMVAGLQGALFGLLPIRFFAGGKIIKWNPWIWGALSLIALFAFWHVLVNPASGYLADSSRTPLVTIVGLLVLFGLGSIAFWAYFRFWRRPAVASAAS